MPAWLHAFRASFTFLTRIPVGGFPYPPKTWEWISIWFPLVGGLLGAMYAAIWLGLDGQAGSTRTDSQTLWMRSVAPTIARM